MAKRPEFLGERERRESRVLSAVLTAACILLILVFAADLYFTQNFLLVIVDGSSMENTLYDGDALYVDVHTSPERGDIIVLNVTDYPGLFPARSGAGALHHQAGRRPRRGRSLCERRHRLAETGG